MVPVREYFPLILLLHVDAWWSLSLVWKISSSRFLPGSKFDPILASFFSMEGAEWCQFKETRAEWAQILANCTQFLVIFFFSKGLNQPNFNKRSLICLIFSKLNFINKGHFWRVVVASPGKIYILVRVIFWPILIESNGSIAKSKPFCSWLDQNSKKKFLQNRSKKLSQCRENLLFRFSDSIRQNHTEIKFIAHSIWRFVLQKKTTFEEKLSWPLNLSIFRSYNYELIV